MSYYLERVQRGVDYIEQRLDEPLDLADVARAAGISQWHFQRMFKALTGETLKTYIRSRRLALSLERLLNTRQRVLDIALLAGFDSQESFARAFKKAFGLTPTEYRQIGRRSLFLKKVQLDGDYLAHIQNNVSPEPELRELAPMRLMGMRTRYHGPESDKNNMGEKLPALWAAFLPRLSEIEERVRGVCYGIVRQQQQGEEGLEYYAVAEVQGEPASNRDMCTLALPSARYAIFAHQGPAQQLDHTVNYIYSTWLARSGYRHTYAADVEIYGPEYHPTAEDSVVYYGIPIR